MAATQSRDSQNSLSDNAFTSHDDSLHRHSPSGTNSAFQSSRQARRIQLRNQNFRAADMPGRPASMNGFSSGDHSNLLSSDSENHSPSQPKLQSFSDVRIYGADVLQEIGNGSSPRASRKQRKYNSPRSLGRIDLGIYNGMDSDLSPTTATIRVSPSKARARMASKAYRAVSEETTSYIEHLESQLVTAQAQLATADATNNAREHSLRIRTLTAEVHKLQEEVAEWEGQYEHRVHDAVSVYAEAEAGLRNQVRALEKDKDDAVYRILELEEQLSSSVHCLQAVEKANVNLEKRVEIMSSLLAASPTRLNLHSESPDRNRRARPRSFVPGPCLSGPFQMSPRFDPVAQMSYSPHSPDHSVADMPLNEVSESHLRINHDINLTPSRSSFDATSIFSEASHSVVDSTTTVENVEPAPYTDFWLSQIAMSAKSKGGRRMRRFGGGGGGPKPLILPLTNNCDSGAYSASASDAQESPNSYARRQSVDTDDRLPLSQEHASFSSSCERATNTADRETLRLRHSVSSKVPSGDPYRADGSSRPHSSDSNLSHCHSSFGRVAAGPTLFEELGEFESSNNDTECFDGHRSRSQSSMDAANGAEQWADHDRENALPYPLNGTVKSFSLTSVPGLQMRPDSAATTTVAWATSHMLRRLRGVFDSLWTSPGAVARDVLRRVQMPAGPPGQLVDLQRWLIGVLLGPMAQRRLNPPLYRSAHPHFLLDKPNSDKDISEDAWLKQPHKSLHASPQRPPDLVATGVNTIHRHEHGISRLDKPESCEVVIDPIPKSWLWIKFSLTLAVAFGMAIRDGPGSLLIVDSANTPRLPAQQPDDNKDEVMEHCSNSY